MVRRFLLWCGAMVVLLAPSLALADPDDAPVFEHSGPYIALDLGYHDPLPIDAKSLSNAPDGRPYNWDFRLNSDWAAFGRVGYRFSPHLRVELDTGLRESNINSIGSPGPEVGGIGVLRPDEPFQLCDHTNAPPPCKSTFGEPHRNFAYADNGLINVIYDFAPLGRLHPFVGVGAGIYHLQFDGHYFFSNVPGVISATNPATQQIQLGGSINRLTQFAYQGLGGVSFQLKRRLALDLTYRYIDAPRLRWNTLNDTPGLTQTEGLQPHDFRGSAQDASVTLGVRYSL